MIVSRAVADSGTTWSNPTKQDYAGEDAAKSAFRENPDRGDLHAVILDRNGKRLWVGRADESGQVEWRRV